MQIEGMRHLTLILTLFFSTMFASPAYAKWEKVAVSVSGDTYYVDFDRIRTNGGYVYFWDLSDYLKPTKWGDLSAKSYKQGDCEMFRYKNLSFSYYKQPMGEVFGDSNSPPNPEWVYPSPNSSVEEMLKRVCEYAETL